MSQVTPALKVFQVLLISLWLKAQIFTTVYKTLYERAHYVPAHPVP